jgi:2-iminobutanoate/2-iminopropanoate deaminase
MLYLSGQIGLDPSTGNLVNGGIEAQARQALYNIGAILDEAGSSYNNTVKCSVYLASILDFDLLNKVYSQFFLYNYPARSTYQVGALPKNASVEIECMAVVGNVIDAPLLSSSLSIIKP